MTAPTLPREDRPRSRTLELVLANAHLRLGSLALARVELETMAGMGRLDMEGLVDLAEVRWRTGDLLGAGEAANAALRGDDGPTVVLVIAAEASAALGRPTEARRLATLALAKADGAIDAVFAGMPRSSVWPGDSAEPPPTAPTLFDRDPEPVARSDVRGSTGHVRAPAEPTPAAAPTTPVELGFWDSEPGGEGSAAPMPDAGVELDAGRAALMAGTVDEAAFRFSLALRMAPALAPAVLEATSGARATTLLVVRGDAYRLAGHEDDARQAYALAAQGGLPERRRRPRPRQKTRVATTGQEVEESLVEDASAGQPETAPERPGDVVAEPVSAPEGDISAEPTAEHGTSDQEPAAAADETTEAPVERSSEPHGENQDSAP